MLLAYFFRLSLTTNPDRPNFDKTCFSDINYFGLFYSGVSLIIGIAIAGVIIRFYKIRADPLDKQYELGFEETEEDRKRTERKNKIKLEERDAKEKIKNGNLNTSTS